MSDLNITNNAECDSALKFLTDLDNKVKKIHSDADSKAEEILKPATEKANAIKLKASKKTASDEEQIEICKTSIADYLEQFQGKVFVDKKSLGLIYGEVGCNDSSAIDADAITVQKLETEGLTDCIKETRSVKKNKLSELSDKILKAVGARRVSKRKFWCKLSGGEKIELRTVEL